MTLIVFRTLKSSFFLRFMYKCCQAGIELSKGVKIILELSWSGSKWHGLENLPTYRKLTLI